MDRWAILFRTPTWEVCAQEGRTDSNTAAGRQGPAAIIQARALMPHAILNNFNELPSTVCDSYLENVATAINCISIS